jgi:hypothetical protein
MTIAFSTGVPKTRIAYTIDTGECGLDVPASFWLGTVRILDSAGRIDSLRVLDPISLRSTGPMAEPQSFPITPYEPHRVLRRARWLSLRT